MNKKDIKHLFNRENNDFSNISDEYIDCFFYLEDYVLTKQKALHFRLMFENEIEQKVNPDNSITKEVERINNTLKVVPLTIHEKLILSNQIADQQIIYSELLNRLQNNAKYIEFVLTELNNINV